MTYLFLDTMIYLHYTWFEDIDWQDVVGDPKVQIVVPHITLDELDTHKDNHKSPKIRERARKVASRLFECITKQNGKLPVVEFDESSSFDFATHNLDKSKNDHRLLAAILEFKEVHSEPVLLMTQDVGPRLKASRLDIKAKPLPETYRMPAEEDPVANENKQMKNELLKLKSAMPKLSLGAEEGGNGRVELVVSPFVGRLMDVESEMGKVHEKYPHRGPRPKQTNTAAGLFALPAMQESLSRLNEMSRISASEYDRYNRDREEYFEECYAYFSERARRQIQCSAGLNLYVANDGGAPAEDVDLYIHFPDGFELYPMDDLPEELKEPSPPQEPRSEIEMSVGRLNFDHTLIPAQHFPVIASSGPPDPFSVKKTNSYEVRDEFVRIKHGQAGVIRPLIVMFDSYESASSFQIAYRISAANLPQPVEGELNVVVKKKIGEGE